MLAEQVEALTDTVRRLRVDVDALRSRAPSEEPPATGPAIGAAAVGCDR